ncbi:MAG: FecR domain-containing protein [Verrucomicrobiaceae bacterium]|nr:FecR domain-containing protein [Verrucomicrobiaceae bacterium]
MKKHPCFLIPLLVSACLAGSPASTIAADFDQAEITKVHQEVKVLKADAAPRKASEGQQIKPVTSVATGAGSRAELRFPDRTLTRLGANSRFTLRGGSRTLDLDRGVMMVQVPKRQGGAQIRTAGVTAAVTGTTVLIEYHPGGVVKLIVIEGECVLTLNRDRGEFQTLRAGQMITMQDGAGSIPAPQNIDLGRLLQSSRLISANDPAQPNQQQIQNAMQMQQQLITSGDLLGGNVVLQNPGVTIGLSNNTTSNVVTPPVVPVPAGHHEPGIPGMPPTP